ncbi:MULTISPECIES: hypothetical protein [Paenibacillus]|uniref:hypothetical protein n=1 Tax=Paenibacillus TaxID=44249 RepID=UPI002FE1AFBD
MTYQDNDLESEINALYSKKTLLYGGYLIQSDFTEKAITAQAILESALPIAGFGISKGIARFGSKGVRSVPKVTGEAPESLTSLYRAVGPKEFYEVMETGKFNVIPEGLQAKQFGLNFDETLKFADKFKDIGAIIEVKVPTSQLNKLADFTEVDKFIFKNGTVTIHVDNLDEFNKIIQDISHKY